MYPTRRQDSVSALDANCLLFRVHMSRMHFESNQETNRHGLDTSLHPIRSSHATPMQLESSLDTNLYPTWSQSVTKTPFGVCLPPIGGNNG